ncbi:MAG TPA: hypothetical protein VHV78_09965, partial [Gemmatimonadaceae bacterium]|nr:hypothetical protein [Gemmatimonadaceae bacterium]
MTPSVATPPTDSLSPQYAPRPRHLAPVDADPDTPWLYLDALRKHRRLLIVLPIVLAVVALGSSLSRSRMYVATAAFIASEPASTSGSLGALSSVASQLGIPGLSAVASSSATSSAQFYGDLLTSSTLLHALVTTRYDANAVAENGGVSFAGTLVDYFHSSGKTETDRVLDVMNRVGHSMLAVTVDRPTGIVRLSIRTKNRQLSALVARRLLDLVNDFNLRRRQTQAGAEREFDARRTDSALDALRAAEATLADFRTTNIDFSRSPRLETREAELERRVTLAQQIYTTVAQRYELANIEAV